MIFSGFCVELGKSASREASRGRIVTMTNNGTRDFMSQNLKGIRGRLQRLEQESFKQKEHKAMAKKLVETRLIRGAIAGLNADELDHFSALMDLWSTNPNANPTPRQQAAFDAYLRHYQDFLTTGRVQTVFGHAVDYSGEWPQAAGTTVGYFLDASWWIEGIGYCLDLHPLRHP